MCSCVLVSLEHLFSELSWNVLPRVPSRNGPGAAQRRAAGFAPCKVAASSRRMPVVRAVVRANSGPRGIDAPTPGRAGQTIRILKIQHNPRFKVFLKTLLSAIWGNKRGEATLAACLSNFKRVQTRQRAWMA